MSRYHFVINYRFDVKKSTNELFKRSNHMFIFMKEIENHKQILDQLKTSFNKDSKKAFEKARIDAMKVYWSSHKTHWSLHKTHWSLQKIHWSSKKCSKSIDSHQQKCLKSIDSYHSNSRTHATKSNVMTTKWKVLIMRTFDLFEHRQRVDVIEQSLCIEDAYQNDSIVQLMNMIRSLFVNDFYVINIEQRLTIFVDDMFDWIQREKVF